MMPVQNQNSTLEALPLPIEAQRQGCLSLQIEAQRQGLQRLELEKQEPQGFVAKEMVQSCFRYKEISNKKHPLKYCSFYGNYYRSAKQGLPDEEELQYPCVIMDYEHNRAIAQIKLARKMGDGYALEVLHIDNTMSGDVKVIYPRFEKTVSGWLEKTVSEWLENKASEIDKRLKDDVIPMIRKLWKLLGKMEENGIQIDQKENNNQGYWMPLVDDGVPKVINLNEGRGNLDRNYPVTIIEEVLEGKSQPLWLGKALYFWKGIRMRKPPSLVDVGKHPALYDSAEKSRFLLLFHRCSVDYELEGWLDDCMHWQSFRNCFFGKSFQDVYEKTLKHGNYKYTGGWNIVRYTRNALVHFEDNYKEIRGKPWDGGEIVEILDEDLAVCSRFFECASLIIKYHRPPPYSIRQEHWDKAKQKLKDFFNSLK